MSGRSLPDVNGLQKLFTDLLGRAVKAKAAGSPLDVTKGALCVAQYTAPDGALGALFVAEVGIAAYLSAALSIVPEARAKEAIKAGALDELLQENFREVCNVVTAALNARGGSPMLVLKDVVGNPATADEAKALTSRLDVEVDVTGYGSGKLAILEA